MFRYLIKTRRLSNPRRTLEIFGFVLIGVTLGFLTKQLTQRLTDPSVPSTKFTRKPRVIFSSDLTSKNSNISLPVDVSPIKETQSQNQSILLLSSLGRSGSSFLGSVIRYFTSIFYYYEPFYNLQQWGMMTEVLAVASLRELYTCNYTGPVFTAIRKRGKKSVRHPYMWNCGRRQSCLDPKDLSKVCSNERTRMVKTIRTRVAWLEPLLSNKDLNLFVIHLVRDPRASIISNWKAGWNVDANSLCTNLLDDLEHGLQLQAKFPDRYIAIRYEDLCVNPLHLATTVAHFLGKDKLSASAFKFLNESTHKDDVKGDDYSLQRNATHQQQKWRETITEKQLTRLESVCLRAINRLGFNIFGSLSVARDVDRHPLYNRSSINSLFTYLRL